MTLKNVYLEETPLTSTENKYLVETQRIQESFFGLTHHAEKSYLLNTKNKFLLEDSVTHKYMMKKKKKRRTQDAFRDQPDFCEIKEALYFEPIAAENVIKRMKKCKMASRVAYMESPVGSDMSDADEVDMLNDIVLQRCETVDSTSVPFGFANAGISNLPVPFAFGSSSATDASGVPFGFGTAGIANAPAPFGFGRAGSSNAPVPLPLFAPGAIQLRSGAMFRGAASSILPCPDILEMPVYSFDSLEKYEVKKLEFTALNTEAHLLQLNKVQSLKVKKMKFLNTASMALMCTSSLKDPNDSYRICLQNFADEVRSFDPEFILKVALYARQELHIRSASNFLLSYAAFHDDTRLFLEKYFGAAINLPSDWIDVAEMYQVFGDERLKNRSLPAALKRVMKKSFDKFDEYQLAKYNRDKARKLRSQEKSLNEDTSEHLKERALMNQKTFTLKQLIRLLHIKTPAEKVMSLLGKKYPINPDVFKSCGLTGIWDSKQAGKRMKLAVPETWETQISSHGNKAVIWETLIDNSKLPYMATLRNIRNLILSGISQKHHEKILKHLENKNAVINSRQLPTQFYEAYKTILELEELLNKKDILSEEDSSKPVIRWKEKMRTKIAEKIKNVSPLLLERYRNTVSKAVEISALHNLCPIPGKTLIICDILHLKKKKFKNKSKSYHTCVMMALMCLKACENSKMKVICGDSEADTIELNENQQFLQVMMTMCKTYEERSLFVPSYHSTEPLKMMLNYYLRPQTALNEKLDHIIYLRSIANECYNVTDVMSPFLHKYRQLVNPELLYTDVDFTMSSSSFSNMDSVDGKDVYLCGSNTQLLKFVAERSSAGHLTYVENIDTKYNLTDISKSRFHKNVDEPHEQVAPLPVYSRLPKWHTIRIFISSTFKDMVAERDLLIRYVIPELKKRAASVFVKINEVDLRWGITESDCSTKRFAELCLLEAQNSDLFIGLLGERYGSIYNFESPDSPDLQWIKEYSTGLSITELEMHAGALHKSKPMQKKAFFYFRDASFMSQVPEKFKSYFISEDEESKLKIENLKSKVLSSGFKVLNGYSCNFAGVMNKKPVLSGLGVFGKTALKDLWEAISLSYSKEAYLDDLEEEEIYQQYLLDSHGYFVGGENSPLDVIIKKFRTEGSLFVISGAPGSGKTAFAVNLLQSLKGFSVIKFFIGLSPRSMDLCYMLQYISNCISRSFPVSAMFPNLTKDVMNQFPDILLEAVKASGNKDFLLLIDGLDHLELDDQMLDWLPLNLPHGLRMICTVSDTSYAFKVLSDRQNHGCSVFIQKLQVLQQSDRESVVRHYLKLYGKALDESPFNNQMLQLVTKKDSGFPLYLRIACDFLRTYASFDNFMSMLKRLPSTIPLVLQEIILQLENEYGSVIVQTVLILLCITKEGLDDADLYFLLSFALSEKVKASTLSFKEMVLKMKEIGPDDLLSQVTYYSLVHVICAFAYGQEGCKILNCRGTEFEKSVKMFYMNKNYSHCSKYMHVTLAAYYCTVCDPSNDDSWKGQCGSAFRGLLFHLLNGRCYQELAVILCSLKFLESAFRVQAADQILEYYSCLINECKTGSNDISRKIDISLLASYRDFVSRNLHVFQLYPLLVNQQALNEPPDSLVSVYISERTNTVECLSRSCVADHRLATLAGFVKTITAAACQKVHPFAILGTEDGYIMVLDLASKKVLRRFKCHSSSVTFIYFAGKNRICVASSDCTLSIWSSDDYSRIAELKGHKHTVTCCCADPSATVLLSSGWDNSVRLWSLRDGRSISVLNEFRCPVNCIDHHPSKQKVACGLWNGNIEIWDTVSLQRTLVFPAYSGSVKAISYTPDGINIITSFINSEVVIFSSEEGLKIANLKGHALPVKSICCSDGENFIISGSDDCTLKVWPTESGCVVGSFSACKFCPVNIMEIISPNLLAVAFQNSEIWMIDMSSGRVIHKMVTSPDLISCFSILDCINIQNKDCMQNWWDSCFIFGTQTGKVMARNFLTSSTSVVGSINARITAAIHNKSIILCGNADGDIAVFSYPESTNYRLYSRAHEGSITTLSLFEGIECVWALSAASDKVLKLWTIDEELDAKLNHEYFAKHNDYITCCCFFSPADCEKENKEPKNILSGSHDNNIILQTDESKQVFQGLQTSVLNLSYSDKYVLGCGSDGSVSLWSLDGILLSSVAGVQQSSAVLAFRIDKDVNNEFDVTLAFVDKDGSVKIKKPLQRSYTVSLEGHSKSVLSCCVTTNGEVLSSSLDGTVNMWKVPLDVPDASLNHSSTVTDIILSSSCDFAISSDAHGNIILWKAEESESPLIYAAKKTYVGGFVRALSWLSNRSFVSVVSQIQNGEEKYFLDVLSYEDVVSEDAIYNIELKKSYYLENEISCIGTLPDDHKIFVVFKSGVTVLITEDDIEHLDLFDKWEENSQLMSFLDGLARCISVSDFLNFDGDVTAFLHLYAQLKDDDIPNCISAFYFGKEEKVFCGDTQGWLRIYSENSMSYSKKIHDDSVTGVCVVGSYVFTSSLDRTVKGWKSESMEQVCQFHSTVPVSCIAAPESTQDVPELDSHILMIGTTAGAVHLLKFSPE